MEQGTWGRLGPISGLLFVFTFVASTIVRLGDPGVRPGSGSAEITAFLDDERGTNLLALYLLVAAMFFLLWFLADLRHRLQSRLLDEHRWVLTALWGGGLLIVAGGLIQALVLQALAVGGEYNAGDASQALLALSWGQSVVMMPGIAAAMAAAAVLSFRFHVVPGWLGILAVLGFLGAFLPWIPVFALWVAATAVLMLINPVAATEREGTLG